MPAASAAFKYRAQKSERPVGGPAARALGMEGTVVEVGWAGPDHSGDSALHPLAGAYSLRVLLSTTFRRGSRTRPPVPPLSRNPRPCRPAPPPPLSSSPTPQLAPHTLPPYT